MRITNNTIVSQSLSGLQANMAALLKVSQQVSTGNRLTAASDDPTAATQIMSASGSLRAIDQYSANVTQANSRVSAEDTALQQITDLLTRAKELGVAQSGSTATADTRTTANAEIQQIFQQILRPLDLDLDERDRVRRTVHHVVLCVSGSIKRQIQVEPSKCINRRV